MGLGGVTVQLSGVSTATTVTDNSGQYAFTGLRMGGYSVEISGFDSDEVGFSNTSSAVTVGVGESKIVSFDGTYLRTAGIQGQVSVEGVGLEGVMVSLAGGPDGEDMNTMTDAAGLYSFAKLRAGDYSVGISGFNTDDYEFAVTSQNVTIALGETANVPFDGFLRRTSGVAGRVSVGGMGIADVTVTVSADGMDDRTAMTDPSGQYAVSALAAGDYTVTISGYDAVEYMFDEPSRTVTLAMDQTEIVNFEGTALRSASIAVSVTADGAGLAGAAVTLTQITGATSGTVLGTQATDANGAAAFGPLLAGEYRVDIAVDSDEIDFESTDATVMVATAEAASVPFAGTINRSGSISGMVTVDGDGMSGVSVMLSGGGDMVADTMMTGDDGSYSFGGLRKGDYTVSIMNPDGNRYEFTSTSESVSLAVGQSQSANFAGRMVRSSSISGRVGLDDGTGVEGVMVTLSGAASAMDTTDAGGLYTFTGLGAGDYSVSITLTDDQEAAYNFAEAETSKDVTLGDNDQQTVHFDGEHDASASVTVRLFIDELTKNNMFDEGEHPFPTPEMLAMVAQAGLPLALPISLEGPGVGETHTGAPMPDGSVVFSGLRAGAYQATVSDISAEQLAAIAAVAPPLAAALADYAFGGDPAGYPLDVGVGEQKMHHAPIDITHTTVNFSASLKSGEKTGDALPGATVTLSSDMAGETKIGAGMTGDDGIASIRVARAGTTGNTVHAKVSHADYDGDGMTTVTWDPQMTSADASNEGDIVNLNVNVNVSGATVDRGDYGGGEALAGWAISVMMGDDAVEGDDVPTMLNDEGSAAFMTSVDAVPVTYTFALADDQDNDLDGGEKYEADAVEYKHDGLSLAGAMDADPLVAEFTTQTLKVYVHHERDQVEGYTGGIVGGDVRVSKMLAVGIRHIDDNGRSRPLPSTVEYGKADSKGVVTFTGVPAGLDIIVTADEAADGIMLLEPNELGAYADGSTMADDAVGGLFGKNGGFSHTVELCPLQAVDPTGQDHGECGSFAFVSTYSVQGLVWKNEVVANATNSDFTVKANPTFVPGITVSLDPVAGKNIAGEAESYTTAEKDTRTDKTKGLNATHQFAFNDIASGVYTLGVEDGWQAMVGQFVAADFGVIKGASSAATAAAAAFAPLDGNVALDVTPSTGVVYGRVIGKDKFPVEGVTVNVNGESDVTDASGRYIVDGFKAQTRTISGTKHSNMVFVETAHPGNEPTRAIIAFAANTPTLQDVSISGVADKATISGTVRMSGSGAPVVGAKIEIDGAAPLNPNTKSPGATKSDIYLTDADGNYSVDVEAKAAGTNVTVTATKAGLTITPVEGIQVPALKDSHISGIGFNAFENATIRGRVAAPAGGPLGGVTVTATSTAAGTTEAADETTTNSVGYFELSVSWGTYEIEATKAGYTFGLPEGRDDWRVTVGPGETASFGDISSSVDDMIATLDDLALSGSSSGALTLKYTDAGGDEQSGFMTDVMAYTAQAENGDAQVTVTAMPTDAANAEFAVTSDQDDAVGDDGVVDLVVGENTITVTVTAADEATTLPYTVVVNRMDDHPKVTLVLDEKEIDESDGATPPVAGVATVNATVAPAPTEDFTVTVSIDASAQVATLSDNAELEYDATAKTWSGTVTITAVNDAVYTGNRTVTVSGVSSDATIAAHPDDVMLTIDDDEGGTPPGEVQGLTAEAGDQQVKLTWERPGQAGSDPITGYKWTATATSATGILPRNGEVGATAREYTVTGLENGVDYTFSVVAVSASGDGAAVGILPTATPMPGIILTLSPSSSLTEGDTDSPITATVRLSNPSTQAMSISVAEVTVADDGTVSPVTTGNRLTVANGANIAIAAGSTTPAAGAAAITITAVQNAVDDDDVKVLVQASDGTPNATASDSDPIENGQQPHEITITDEDEAPSALDFLDAAASATTGEYDLTWGFRLSGDASWGTGTTTQQFQICFKADGTACSTDDEWAGTGATSATAAGNARSATTSGFPTSAGTYIISVRANTEAGGGPASTVTVTVS